MVALQTQYATNDLTKNRIKRYILISSSIALWQWFLPTVDLQWETQYHVVKTLMFPGVYKCNIGKKCLMNYHTVKTLMHSEGKER